MSINKEFYAPREKTECNGIELCVVRGLTPDDIAQAMVENTADMQLLIETMENDKSLAKIDPKNSDEIMAALTDNSGKVFLALIQSVPNLAAKIIAICADDPTAADYIKREYVLPIQLEILTKIAKLTFVNEGGFKAFLGNAMALVGKGSDQRQNLPNPSADSVG